MPKFSVITVSKNSGFAISDTIDSVKKQVFKDFEYIVIDGESTDTSIEIIHKKAKLIDKTIIEKDKGIYHAMNKGIKAATGEYILFLNAGDEFTTSYTLAAINTKIQQHKAEVYFGKILWVDTQNNNVITSKHDHIKYKSQLYNENFPHPATIYSKQAFEKYGLFDLNFPIYADYEWNLRALIKNNASFYYGDFIVTTFYTGGISTNNQLMEQKEEEKKRVKKKYFQQKTKQISINNIFFIKRIKLRLTNEKLNKIY